MTGGKKKAQTRKAKRPTMQPKRSRTVAKAKKQGKAPKQNFGKRGSSSVSMVNDGVNVGSVWKNTTAERVPFPVQREKVTDLTSASTAFQLLQQFYINPANSALFPVFSQIASCYEEYIPTHLKFFFRTEEYMASGSVVSAGLVALGTNFDANDANFPTLTSLENYEHSISGPPFSGIMVHDVLAEHRRRFKGKARDLALQNYFVYPSVNSIGPSTDQAKWYDIGNFQLACNGCQAGLMGELWVEYAFTMIRRKQPETPLSGPAIHVKLLAADATAASPLGLTSYTTGSVASTGPTVSGIAPGSTMSVANMGASLPLVGYTPYTIGLNDSSDASMSLPNLTATWLVQLYWTGANIASIPTVSTSSGAVQVSVYDNAAASGFVTVGATLASFTGVFTSVATAAPTSSSNRIIVAGLATMITGNVDIFVVRIPNTLLTTTNGFIGGSQLAELSEMQAARINRLERLFELAGLDDEEEEKEYYVPDIETCSSTSTPRPRLTGARNTTHVPLATETSLSNAIRRSTIRKALLPTSIRIAVEPEA